MESKIEVLYSFEGCINDPWQLKCVKGTILHLREEYSDGWCYAVNPETRKQGIVPTSWVRKVSLHTNTAAPAADPKFEKYERMKKAGLPEGAILNAMSRDGVIPPGDFFASGNSETSQSNAAKSNKVIDPKYEKYERMKKAGLPEGAIVNAMARDGVTPPAGFLDSENSETIQSNAVKTKRVFDQKYAKYERMKKAGLPEGAILNAMNRDGVTPPAGFFDSSENSETLQSNTAKSSKLLDPKYAKYERMKKAGLPEGAIINAMNRDGVVPPTGFFLEEDLALSTIPRSPPSHHNKTAAQGPSSFLAGIKGFDKTKLQASATNSKSNSDNNIGSTSGNSLLDGISGFNRNALKKTDNFSSNSQKQQLKSSVNSASSAKSMMDIIKERARERKKRSEENGLINTFPRAQAPDTSSPSTFSPKALRKTHSNKIIPSGPVETTPTKPAWMQVKLKSTPSSKNLVN
eukprot:CAMPEP_0204836052 /NCGR_PEP_ID=MMETSP1346-20131115/24224_1 /ASSEMBLY_ACC=CAM_ASM_000771 /TAXON_ID=215587 /ORGANISM="Aplanochytrium stocchinoi, Strain GSBS06" /LENGTH=460 /DNA_ID=CAMNT_0051970517 /DNA_START=246 /DNA_END=1628 /DNA_ORIENTATION=-